MPCITNDVVLSFAFCKHGYPPLQGADNFECDSVAMHLDEGQLCKQQLLPLPLWI